MRTVLSPKWWLAIGTAGLLAAMLAMLPLAAVSRLPFDAVVALVIGVPCGVVGPFLAFPTSSSSATGWQLLSGLGWFLFAALPVSIGVSRLTGVVQEAFEPAHVGLWLSGGAR